MTHTTPAKFQGHILVIDARIITPDRDGGSLRLRRLLDMLLSLDYAVTFAGSFRRAWPPFDATLEQDTQDLEAAGIRVLRPEETPDIGEHLRRAGPGYDIVWLSGGVHIAARHIGAVRRWAPQAHVIFDTVDLNHIREYRKAKITGSKHQLAQALHTKQQELAVAREADVTLVVSEEEQQVLQAACPALSVRIVSNVHDVHDPVPGFAKRRDFLFLGAFQHAPNVDAVHYFAGEIFPHVHAALPETRWYIVGSHPPDTVQALASDAVIVTGFAPELRPYFERCRLSVAPLRFGAGVKGKLLLSLGYGVPAVATPVAAEGTGLRDGRELLIAGEPRDFAQAVARLYADAALWQRLSSNGQQAIRARFSYEAVRRTLVDVLTSLPQRRIPDI